MKLFMFVFAVLFSFKTWAFKVVPMVVEFSDRGKEATQTFTASHDGDEKIAVEVEAATRKLNLNGKEERGDTEDLLIYPPQLILKKGEKKKIRVTYIGKKFE